MFLHPLWSLCIGIIQLTYFQSKRAASDPDSSGPGTIGTCSGTPFDTKRFQCCDNFEICPNHLRKCCGKHCYSVGSSLCCDGRIIDKCSQFNSVCCGQICIDQGKSACRNGRPVVACAGPESAWCREKCYDSSTHLCCDNRVIARCGYDRSTAECCGSECYNKKTESCCNGVVLHPKCSNDQCCEQKCCDAR